MVSRRAGRHRFTFFLLLLSAFTLITLDAQDFGPVERTKDGLATLLGPVGTLVGKVADPLEGAWDDLSGNEERDQTIAELRDEAARLREEVIVNQAAVQDYERLLDQLELDTPEGIMAVVANVEAGSVSNFDGEVIQISKGTESGIRNGMPVLGPGGLIGRIDDARDGRSVVRLIVDPSFAVGVRFSHVEENAVAHGDGRDRPLVVLDGVRADLDLEVGATVVTSGGDRSLYPADLPVGRVAAITIDEGDLELEVTIDPSGFYEDLVVVTVLLFDPEAPPLPTADPTATPTSLPTSTTDPTG